MTTAIEVLCSSGTGDQGIINGVGNAISNFTTVLDGSTHPTEGVDMPDQESPIEKVEPPEATTHLRGLYRVDDSETVSGVLDDIENVLTGRDWYELRTHNCDHDISDGTGSGGCSEFTAQRSSGTVPEDV